MRKCWPFSASARRGADHSASLMLSGLNDDDDPAWLGFALCC